MTAKNTTYTLGVILLVLGVWGFFQDPVLGVFAVNTTTNLFYD